MLEVQVGVQLALSDEHALATCDLAGLVPLVEVVELAVQGVGLGARQPGMASMTGAGLAWTTDAPVRAAKAKLLETRIAQSYAACPS